MTGDRVGIVPPLVDYYQSAGVAAADLYCENAVVCQAAMPGVRLCRGRAAYVGSNYGKAVKILIVSMDDGGTPVESRESIEAEIAARRATVERAARTNPHMIGTAAFAEVLLREVTSSRGIKDYLSFCAMVNAAKCSSSTGATSPKLYERCWPFAAQEIEILRPELIWLQGNRVHETVAAANSPAGGPELWDLPDQNARFPKHIRFFLYKGTTPVIKTRHPSANGGYRPNFLGDDIYRAAAKMAVRLAHRHSFGRR